MRVSAYVEWNGDIGTLNETQVSIYIKWDERYPPGIHLKDILLNDRDTNGKWYDIRLCLLN